LIERAVIFQDKHLLVIDKPAGVAVHGGSGMSFGVIEALRASRPHETLELVIASTATPAAAYWWRATAPL